MILKALLVDDEENSRTALKNMLVDYCKDVTVIGEVGTVEKAVEVIKILQPNLVFLDIVMPKENGFELFNYFDKPTFDVIFSTAYNDYAVKAFQLSAIDYLLKPVDLVLLRNAIEKVKEKKLLDSQPERIAILGNNMGSSLEKISLPTSEGYLYMEIKNIIRCEAQGNYTQFYFKDGNKILVSKTLKGYESVLADLHFFRINRSQLVNLKCIKMVGRQRNPSVILDDGTELVMTSFRKDEFFKKMGKGI
jgi:two-component system LytT family response regulator